MARVRAPRAALRPGRPVPDPVGGGGGGGGHPPPPPPLVGYPPPPAATVSEEICNFTLMAQHEKPCTHPHHTTGGGGGPNHTTPQRGARGGDHSRGRGGGADQPRIIYIY